jgi:hypothetical protein
MVHQDIQTNTREIFLEGIERRCDAPHQAVKHFSGKQG